MAARTMLVIPNFRAAAFAAIYATIIAPPHTVTVLTWDEHPAETISINGIGLAHIAAGQTNSKDKPPFRAAYLYASGEAFL